MLETLLRTKLYMPPLRPNMVPQQRLIERLDQGLRQGCKLTLISAPAGFGKTSLAGAWVAGCGRAAAWLSADEADNDPVRFLAYLVAALQTIAVELGAEVMALLQAGQAAPTEAVLTNLLNEVSALADPFVLVIDDYHTIEATAVDEMVAFLIEQMPPQMHLLLTTREDPKLPLPRLRVRGQLSELRVADLRFTAAEAAEFLNQVMGLALAEEEIAALETRTEGWVAGLQMAGLSLQGRADVADFVQAFTGSHHFVMDYLVEEVLQQQPDTVRRFLLQTSILERLSGPLCTAVTGQAESQQLLETLERSNLLIVPLDDERRWYRYHHLFADVLQAHVLMEQPAQVPILHQRASAWYEAQGSTAEAIRHALAAEDFERAARLLEQSWPEMNSRFQNAAWLAWMRALPEAVIDDRPVLLVDYGWALLNNGEMEAAEVRLRQAERLLNRDDDAAEKAANMIVVDAAQFQTLAASLATARAYQAQALGDAAATIRHGRQALVLYPDEDHLQRGIVASIVALAYWARGELEAAHDTMAAGMADMQAAGSILFALRGTYILADIRLAQGRLREAIRTYENLLALAAEQNEAVQRGTADLHLRLSELYFEQNQSRAAAEQMARGEALGVMAASPIWRYRLCLAQARMAKAQGDLDGALALLDEAERQHIRNPVPDLYPIQAWKARVWVAQGRLAEALAWAHEQGLSADDDLSYQREFEHITLARLALARGQLGDMASADAATSLLARLLGAAEAGGRTGSVIEILALLALAHEAQGSTAAALAALERALGLAAPEGYVRLFVDEGAPMARLLTAAQAQGIRPDYTGKLLSALEAQQQEGGAAAQPLVEPLSARELEILGLIAQGLSNREISERLFLALSTVKGHNGRIFGKLAVQNRTEAAARARELGLL